MKKWWFLLIIISIISIMKCGYAIDLTQQMKKNQSPFVKINGFQSGITPYEENDPIKLVNNTKIPKKYAGSYFKDKTFDKIEALKREDLTKPNPKIVKPMQVKEIKKPIQMEQPKVIVKPSVYLTFDDGPNQELNLILNILKTKKAKATFFMIEPQMKHYQGSIKRLVKEGNYPALHSVTHDKNKVYSSPLKMISEMEQTRQTLLALTGVDSELIRAPYGSKPYMTDPFRNALVQHHMKMWDWSIDTLDWKFQRTNPHQILVNTIQGMEMIKNKKGPIVILMHVTKGTASVLPQVIDYIYSKGYQCPAYDPSKHVIENFWNDRRL